MKGIMLPLILLGFAVTSHAQLTPQEALKSMERGINIGNTMDPPYEGQWGNPPVQERAFDDYRSAGFTAVRIPITWDKHTSLVPPYAVDNTWMNRVEEVVDWGLSRGLIIIIDAHHESWLKDALADAATNLPHADSCIARFDSIWSQIAVRFSNKSDSLIFEILNEPYPMSESNTDSLNASVLRIIRRTNPTRIVSFSGYKWSNSDQLVTAAIPDSSDKYLIGYYHSYDPWNFGGLGLGTYGGMADIAGTATKFDQVSLWSANNGIPVILDEFGYIRTGDYNSRMCAYATVVDQALRHGVGAFAWDDGGNYPIYDRVTGTFNEIKDILVHTYPTSPYRLSLNEPSTGKIELHWTNRYTGGDSIVVERGTGGADFSYLTTLPPLSSDFVDSSVAAGLTYYYKLSITTADSTVIQSYPIRINVTATDISSATVPAGFSLSDNYPNPFNPSTLMNFSIPRYGVVTLKIYDVLGREVKVLVDEPRAPGRYTASFDGSKLPSGIYFARLKFENRTLVRQLVLVK